MGDDVFDDREFYRGMREACERHWAERRSRLPAVRKELSGVLRDLKGRYSGVRFSVDCDTDGPGRWYVSVSWTDGPPESAVVAAVRRVVSTEEIGGMGLRYVRSYSDDAADWFIVKMGRRGHIKETLKDEDLTGFKGDKGAVKELVKARLAERFPGQGFRVGMPFGMKSIEVKVFWTDGPSRKEFDRFVEWFLRLREHHGRSVFFHPIRCLSSENRGLVKEEFRRKYGFAFTDNSADVLMPSAGRKYRTRWMALCEVADNMAFPVCRTFSRTTP